MIERNSTTWRYLDKKLKEDIAFMREQNDSELDEAETAKLRGRIEYAKELLELNKKPGEAPEVIDTTYVD